MYLFDTNIFLEILLAQEKADICKQWLTDCVGKICISDFSLHSIGVILFRFNKSSVFASFLADILPKVEIVGLCEDSYACLPALSNDMGLDFDDAYQVKVAEDRSSTVLTMDKDFRRAEGRVPVRFI